MESGSTFYLVRPFGQGDALAGDFFFEFFNGRDVLIDDRLIDERPKGFGRLRLGTIGRQINKANTIWDFQIGWPMPPVCVENLIRVDAATKSAKLEK